MIYVLMICVLSGCESAGNVSPSQTSTPPLSSEPTPGAPPTGTPVIVPPPTAVPSSPATVPPTADPGEGTAEPGSAAEAILARCLNGKIAFRPPSPMRQGEKREFVLRAALAGSPVDPSQDFPGATPGSNPVEIRLSAICEQMRADLVGDGIEVERIGNPSGTMLLPGNGFGEWSWYLTPVRSGQLTMILTLYAPGTDDADIGLATYREKIDVEVGLGYAIATFVKEWAPPLGLTIPVVITALGGLLAWWWRRSYKPKHAPADQRPG